MTRRNREMTPEQLKAFEESPLWIDTKKKIEEMTKSVNQSLGSVRPILELGNKARKEYQNMINQREYKEKNEREALKYMFMEDPKLTQLKEINKKLDTKLSVAQNEYIITYNTKYNTLSRSVDGEDLVYDIAEDGKRKKFIDFLISNNRNYVPTEKVRQELDCPTHDAVSALKKAINRKARLALNLGDTGLIKGKQYSGYKINPKVTILKKK